MTKIIDRLYNRVEEKGHVCLGLDTDPEYIPSDFASGFSSPAQAVFEFNKKIIDATLNVTACYKVQIAYYEALGLAGLKAYADTLGYLRDKKAIIIADIKRGDIAKTAEMYAKAHFTGDFEADFITLNPFMGADTITPFMEYITQHNKGLFALVATSNPGANDIQGLVTENGETVTQKVGDMLNQLAENTLGECGFSPVGAVVGCTNQNQTKQIRKQLENLFFLIPGYGAQGGTANDMKNYLKNGNGGVVNSSRGILLAYKKDLYNGMDFDEAARAECIRMKEDIISAL